DFLVALARDPEIRYHRGLFGETIYNCGLTPRKFRELVEKNPRIAVEILANLIKSPYKSEEYLTALCDMGLNLHSMEVMNGLITAVEPESEFFQSEYFQMYITTCISSCMNIKFNTTFLEPRLRCILMDGKYMHICP
ncbi:UPF0760 C2orf29-like protein, partial [Trifolium pratense]